eukprot:1551436-Amphidinium_carterae.7
MNTLLLGKCTYPCRLYVDYVIDVLTQSTGHYPSGPAPDERAYLTANTGQGGRLQKFQYCVKGAMPYSKFVAAVVDCLQLPPLSSTEEQTKLPPRTELEEHYPQWREFYI